jgi:D-alanyl-D-alanine carboxypeptidase (penicillin-binding protein 5/6)
LAYKAVSEGRISLSDPVTIHREDCAPDLPYRSSLMFLEAGMRVSLKELLVGLAIPSGNDAAFAVARAVSGDIESFARDMNQEVRGFGLRNTRFVEPSGLSEKNMTTARDFSSFCRSYISLHPQALTELHSLPEIRFPLLENMPAGYKGGERAIEQKNKNSLIFDYPGCDGLKTGYIDESGYNIALTAQREGTRLIAVLLGGPGSSTVSGSVIRAMNGKKLLDYGFDHFVTMRPQIVSIKPVRIWKGKTGELALEPGSELVFTARKAEAPTIVCKVERDLEAMAPIRKGQAMGELVFSSSGKVVKRIPLVAAADVEAGNVLKRLWDGILLFFRGGMKKA